MAASSRRKPRGRRSAPARPTLEQRHWDLIGLGLVALAVFLAFLVYLGWEGGTAGGALVDGLRDLIGAVHVLAPVALLAAGSVLVLRPVLPAMRPFRAAAACLLLSSCLGLAAGTLGLGGPNAEVVAAVLVYRAFTVLPTLLLGLGTIAAWKWLGPEREEGVDDDARNRPAGEGAEP